MKHLEGIYAPIPTPFNKDESIAYDQLKFNLNIWVNEPLDGIVIPGSNSEAPYLSHEERLKLWESCAGILRGTDKNLIAGTGVETTAETIALTKEAAHFGAVAALVIPPIFYKPQMTHDILIAHYQAIADDAPLPILIYHIPAFVGYDISASTLIALASHPNIIGMKDSSSNLIKIGSVLKACPDFKVFAGTGSAFFPFICMGAVGGIMALANFASQQLKDLYDLYLSLKMDEAQKLQHNLIDINTAVTSGFGVPGLKYVMDRLGYYGGPCRRPLLPLNLDSHKEIDNIISNFFDKQ